MKAIVKSTRQIVNVEHYQDSTSWVAVTRTTYTDGVEIYKKEDLIFPETDKADRSKCLHLTGEFQSNGYAKCDIGACGIGSACSCYPNLELMKCCDNHEQTDTGISVDIETLKDFLKEYREDRKNLMNDDFDDDEIIWCLIQKLNDKPWKMKDLNTRNQ